MVVKKGRTPDIEETALEPKTETGAGTMNRTGVKTSPEMALDLIREAQKTPPDPKGDAGQLAAYRRPYLEERVITGSMPRASDASADPSGPEGQAGSLLLDKLGERLAFERQGVRLYECLIGKVKILGRTPGGPRLEELVHILEEEKEHFRFLQDAIAQSGGDPTVQTPCANIAGVLSQGILQVVADPRTTVVQCLEAMLTAELTDNDGWSMLLKLVEAAGADELSGKIEEAEGNEREHLAMVRSWLSALVVGEDADGEILESSSKAGGKSDKGIIKSKPGSGGKGASKPSLKKRPDRD